MNEDLKFLKLFITEMNKTNSTLDKKKVIGNFPMLQKMFSYVYDEINYVYGIKSSNIKKNKDLEKNNVPEYKDLYDLLNALNERVVTGHDAIKTVQLFIENNKEYEEEIYRIIDRDLKVRADIKAINKVFPGCIPVFSIPLAEKYPDFIKKVIFSKDIWFASRKLDGCRCVTVIDEQGNVKFFSRKGKEFFTLGNLLKSIQKLNLKNVVFDGEICIMDENGNEVFKNIMKEIKRKDHTIDNPKYCVFDMVDLQSFKDGQGNVLFSERTKNLLLTLNKIPPIKHIEIVTQTIVTDEEIFNNLRETARNNGWEGLIIRKNVGYEGKRSQNMLKVKDFIDAEYEVKRIETGPFRIIKEGKEITVTTMTSAIIEHKGVEVGVGSGFSLEERNEFFEDPSKIIGKIICVKYFGETENDKGTCSLRFPTFKYLYEDRREE